VKKTLDEIRNRAAGGQNLMPYIFKAVAAYATVGEITDCLRKELGEYKPKF
jgi:methylmalonyl-CoA mutase N-terminal domain/subunit